MNLRGALFIVIFSVVSLAFGQTETLLDSLVKEIENATEDTDRINLWNRIADEYNNFDSAKTAEYTQKSIQLSNEINYPKGKSDALYIYAWAVMRAGSYSEARELFYEAYEVANKANYLEGISSALNGLGVIHRRMGDYQTSLKNQLDALKINEQLGDQRKISSTFNNIGFIYEVQDDFTQALDYYKRSIAIKETQNISSGLSNTYNNIGNIYYSIGNYNDALPYYKKSLDINLSKNDLRGTSSSYNNLGKAYMRLALYDSAEYYLTMSLDLAYQINNKPKISVTSAILGENYSLMGEYKKGRKLIQEGIETAKSINDPLGIMYGMERLARVSYNLGNFRDAYLAQVEYMNIQDSLKNDERTRELARIKAEYEYQQELDSIEFIKAKEDIQIEAELKRRTFIQNFTFVGLAIAVILLIVILYNYRSKQRLNNILTKLNYEFQNKNIEIKSQRDHLEQTISELKKTQSNLVEAEKMASLGILTSGVAHEINNPLNYIKGAYLTLENYFKENDKSEEENIPVVLDSIREGVDRASKIVQGLNQFSRDNKNYNELCDIHSILDNCLVMLNHLLMGRVEVKKEYHSEALVVMGNVGKLHQVFINVLTNAVQAIPEEGIISIKTGIRGTFATVEIIDSGQGITDSELNKVFSPFFTTKEPGQGTGLGLSITYNIIIEHNGEIKIDSEPDGGTKVYIKLPLPE